MVDIADEKQREREREREMWGEREGEMLQTLIDTPPSEPTYRCVVRLD